VCQSSPTVLASGPIARSGDAISIDLHQPDSMPAAVRAVWATAPTITTPAATTKCPAQPCSYSLKRPPCSPDSKQVNGCNGLAAWSRP
jgi:hypothetical protein